MLYHEPETHPSIFIASSGVALGIARNLEAELNTGDYGDCTVHVWEDFFGVGRVVLHRLVEESKGFDFGIMILTPDDEVTTPTRTYLTARDNVVFEAGLFIGTLGITRVIPLLLTQGNTHILSDIEGLEQARFHWEGAYRVPTDPVEKEEYDRNMRIALRDQVCHKIRRLLNEISRRALKRVHNNIYKVVEQLETEHIGNSVIDRLFISHTEAYMNKLEETLRHAREGVLELIHPVPNLLPQILSTATSSVQAVAHYNNIGWWTMPGGGGNTYLEAHRALGEQVDIERVFILPLWTLADHTGNQTVLKAIEANCASGVRVRLLLWRTEADEASISIGGASHDVADISHLAETLTKDLRVSLGWRIEDDLSFLIIDERLVSSANGLVPYLEVPSHLLTSPTRVEEFRSIFIRLKERAMTAEFLLPALCK